MAADHHTPDFDSASLVIWPPTGGRRYSWKLDSRTTLLCLFSVSDRSLCSIRECSSGNKLATEIKAYGIVRALVGLCPVGLLLARVKFQSEIFNVQFSKSVNLSLFG